jgi:alpha-ketoglutarate-dependent taurine dioxygenase
MFSSKPLSEQIGVEISGIDLSVPLDGTVLRKFLRLFYDNCVVVAPNQDLNLSKFHRVACYLGRPKPHFLDHLRLPGFDDVLLLSNIHQNGRPIGIYEGAAFWHTDVAYEDPPNTSTVVYAIQVPDTGGRTWFANQYAAYDALPESMKNRIDELKVIHHYGNRADMDENSRTSAERLTEAQKSKVRNVVMPLVRRHPFTGRKALYGVAGSSFHIAGMPDDEAMDLLNELAAHATQPEFVTSHRYRKGDLALWDTFSTLHKAELIDPVYDEKDSDARLLYRISLTGHPTYPLGDPAAGL